MDGKDSLPNRTMSMCVQKCFPRRAIQTEIEKFKQLLHENNSPPNRIQMAKINMPLLQREQQQRKDKLIIDHGSVN